MIGSQVQPQVLIVEDSSDDAILATRAFRRLGVEAKLTIASDGAEAIQAIEQGPDEGFALILLDLKLPKISGLDVLQAIRSSPKGRRSPVVIFSSSDERTDVERSYELGANSYIRKPVDYDEFMTGFSSTLKYWLLTNIAPSVALHLSGEPD